MMKLIRDLFTRARASESKHGESSGDDEDRGDTESQARTLEVSFPVAEFVRSDDPPSGRHSAALARARNAKDRAQAAFLALAGRRRVSVRAVDFVEFDSDNADVALAYFAVDYQGENIDG